MDVECNSVHTLFHMFNHRLSSASEVQNVVNIPCFRFFAFWKGKKKLQKNRMHESDLIFNPSVGIVSKYKWALHTSMHFGCSSSQLNKHRNDLLNFSKIGFNYPFIFLSWTKVPLTAEMTYNYSIRSK